MADAGIWFDDYWLLVLRLYMRKPAGVKPLYSRDAVALAMELHTGPAWVRARQEDIAAGTLPVVRRLVQLYGGRPQKLRRAVERVRAMDGFNSSGEFYAGVAVSETFEGDFRPLADDPEGRLLPVMLHLALDLYFRLTTITMVEETPEVAELARLMRVGPDELVGWLLNFQHVDPYIRRADVAVPHLLEACRGVWNRFAATEPDRLAAYAEQLKWYFR